MRTIQIVGGGVSGLSAGIFLQKAGYRTAIYERHTVAGGNLTGWDRGAYHIDNCMHWLNGTRRGSELHRRLCEIGALGEDIEVRKLPYFYRCEGKNGESVAFYRSLARTRREMLALSPEDAREIDRFLRAVSVAARSMAGKEGSIFRIDRIPQLLKYGTTTLFRLGERFQHPLLSASFSDYIGGEFSSLALILAYASFIIGNADLPFGGSRAMASRIAERYKALGGELHTGCEVSEIAVENQEARALFLSDGTRVEGDGFVLACDPAVTFGRLLSPGEMPQRLLSYYRSREKFPIFSGFHAAFRVDTPHLPFRGCTSIPVSPITAGKRIQTRLMLREFSHEATFMPEGRSLIQSWIFTDEADAKEWLALSGNRPLYEEKKREKGEEMLMRILLHYPALRGKISLLDTWTPATYRRFYGGFYGAFMSFAVTGRALPLSVTPHLRHIKNAVLATQWQSPPGGIPTAISAGKRATEALMRLFPPV